MIVYADQGVRAGPQYARLAPRTTLECSCGGAGVSAALPAAKMLPQYSAFFFLLSDQL